MKKFFFCVSLVLTGLMTSCVDKYEEVDAESKPTWLGGSIYAELKNPDQERLTGTFNTYLRLVDDLGYAETLGRTGSKTVFPANDEAFERFFSSNDWGVTSYEQLSEAQKKLLLYNSMLDNAILLGMLPNAYNSTADPSPGEAIKHSTTVSVIDTIQHMTGDEMPKGNIYWDKYREKGIDVVTDGTRPMLVHLTREYMLNKGITVVGDESDFAILTGTPYAEGNAYVFNVGIQKNPNTGMYNGDRTCLNGYIHQMEEVVVPPGNMGQVLRRHDKTRYFSRILDHYAAPYYDANITRQYNDWAVANGRPRKDSIFQMRYLSTHSQGDKQLSRDPNGIDQNHVLNIDPGWNQYYPEPPQNSRIDPVIRDIAAFFVPDDEAVKTYFLPGGGGSHLIAIYGSTREGEVINDEEHLMENLDSLFVNKPEVLTDFCKLLLKTKFSETVPSMFPTVTNDASENMGLTIDMLDHKADGKYDITIANNGVVYLINEMIVPDKYRSVMAPTSEYPDMRVMGWAVQDGTKNGDYLQMDFQYFLLAMSANYAFFIPEDEAFDLYYIDPASLGHVDAVGNPAPEALHIFFDAATKPNVKFTRHSYNPVTGEVDPTPLSGVRSVTEIRSQMQDILNYHTLVLGAGEEIGQNHYYKTKHGGEVYVDGNFENGRVMSGIQIESPDLFPAPKIKWRQHQKNGWAYRLDRVIQPPHRSVYSVLAGNPQFSEFLDVCEGFGVIELLAWAGISDQKNPATGSTPQDAFTIFTRNYKLGTTTHENACLDYNVKMFNTFNYTLFAPDNTAMQKAYSDGLPRWKDIQALYEKYPQEADHEVSAAEQADMDRAQAMIRQLRDFVRYHFVSSSVYVDNTIEGGRYQSLCSDATGVAKEIRVSGGNGEMVVGDMKSGHTVTVRASDGGKVVNQMTRDYWFNDEKTRATGIETSSFCAVHQISEPLYGNASGKFNE